jgi:hypothetical protein
MKQIILMSFNSITEGLNFMSTFQYPCAFTVNRNWDRWYNQNGVLLENIPEQKYSNIMLPNPEPFMYCLVDNWVNNEYCYDGSFVFVTRNKNQ